MNHLDLDALADVLAGSPSDHLPGCAQCQAALEQLRAADALVGADLAALSAAPLPAVPARLSEPVRPTQAASTNVLPAATPIGDAPSRRRSWLPAAGGIAAAAVLVVGGGLLLTSNAGDSSKDAATADSAGKYTVTSSGTDYTSDASLAKALPGLLTGGARSTAAGAGKAPETATDTVTTLSDPLATLRTPTGLAACLASLTDPSESGVPLALDYASYKGSPALVVVLPSSKPSKVDVWVVGPACNQLESDLLVYVKADRP